MIQTLNEKHFFGKVYFLFVYFRRKVYFCRWKNGGKVYA